MKEVIEVCKPVINYIKQQKMNISIEVSDDEIYVINNITGIREALPLYDLEG